MFWRTHAPYVLGFGPPANRCPAALRRTGRRSHGRDPDLSGRPVSMEAPGTHRCRRRGHLRRRSRRAPAGGVVYGFEGRLKFATRTEARSYAIEDVDVGGDWPSMVLDNDANTRLGVLVGVAGWR
jgi:hypothetical protein